MKDDAIGGSLIQESKDGGPCLTAVDDERLPRVTAQVDMQTEQPLLIGLRCRIAEEVKRRLVSGSIPTDTILSTPATLAAWTTSEGSRSRRNR